MNKWISALALGLVLSACAEKPYGALPTPEQIAWQDMELNMFCLSGTEYRTSIFHY